MEDMSKNLSASLVALMQRRRSATGKLEKYFHHIRVRGTMDANLENVGRRFEGRYLAGLPRA